ncbi:MAG: GIY-YIG nuclease family protein [Xanthomarina sp.]
MICIYLQTITTEKKAQVPYRLTLINSESLEFFAFTFRPEITISKKTFERHHLNLEAISSSSPFIDIADDLIEIFQNNTLTFSEIKQFQLLKSQFNSIGYNFNIKPKYLFFKTENEKFNPIEAYLKNIENYHAQSLEYGKAFVYLMADYANQVSQVPSIPKTGFTNNISFQNYKMAPGVYYFLDALKEVIYVGKAKNIRKRLQSHFSPQTKSNAIDYSKVKSIQVAYSGNDILAQLIESAHIKALKPIYNTQQVTDPAPYIINKSETANGIYKLQITRKDIKDNLPEKYFNRLSVKRALETFCADYNLCRKHCGLERVKGPCSKVTIGNNDCVCSGNETIDTYNKRFEMAFFNFKNRKARKIYKLKGRHKNEDAFIYLVNGIYEGYGFIDKNESLNNINDILGHLILQTNNYDTSRIVSALDNTISSENILILNEI